MDKEIFQITECSQADHCKVSKELGTIVAVIRKNKAPIIC